MSFTSLSVAPDGSHHTLASGEPAYPERFDEVLKFHAPGLAPVIRQGEAWHIRADGSAAYERRFRRTFGFYEGLAAVTGADGWHHVTPEGRDAYAERYAWCGNFQGERCPARDSTGAYLHICADGRAAYEHRWRYAGDYRDGIAVVQAEDGLSTHVDRRGRPVHDRWFVDLDVFHKGFARARDEEGWTHVDGKGGPLYARRFAAVEPFYNGQARVERFDGAFEVIDESGTTVALLRPPRRSGLAAPSGEIPPSLLAHLDRIPRDQPVALLLRHSERDRIPPGDAGNALPITDVGRRLARELGALFGGRLRTLHTSPVLRCVQTAEALREGAGAAGAIVPDRLLGDPGVYVLDAHRAWVHWERLGHEGVVQHLVTDTEPLSDMARPDEAARFLVQHMLAIAGEQAGIHVFVTHDSLVTATAARLLGRPLGPSEFPWYLEGAFFFRRDGEVCAAYRGHEARRPAVLCPLEHADVIELARREIAATVGLHSGARFFLAGGAFKTLLSGRPPRDLDLWAPSEADRRLLLSALHDRGARRLDARPFADGFDLGGRVIEVPHKVDPPTLDERLSRFDIALSAIGVEHHPDGAWSATIHPLARESVRRREVLLLKPLVNWKYALTTLERLRRYAAELAFDLPREEEAEVWRVFESQPRDVQAGMLERYSRTGAGGFGVAEEAARRGGSL